jgi:hypothetical protein
LQDQIEKSASHIAVKVVLCDSPGDARNIIFGFSHRLNLKSAMEAACKRRGWLYRLSDRQNLFPQGYRERLFVPSALGPAVVVIVIWLSLDIAFIVQHER